VLQKNLDGNFNESQGNRHTQRESPAGLLCLLLIWAGFVVLTSSSRVGLLHDSVTHLDTARQLLNGDGLTHRWAYWDPVYETARLPTRTTMWPPGYAIFTAALSWFGLTPYLASRLIAGISLSLLPVALHALARLTVPTKHHLTCTMVALVCLPIARLGGMVITEPTFLLLFILCIVSTIHAKAAVSAIGAMTWLGLASLAGGAAFMFRYLGASTAVALAVSAIWICLSRPRKQWPGLLFAAGLPVAAIIGAWMLRERMIGGAGGLVFQGTRKPLLTYLLEAPRNILSDWLGWRTLYPGIWRLSRPLQLMALMTIFAIATVQIHKWRRRERNSPEFLTATILASVFVSCYLLVMYAGVVSKDLVIESRYVTILLPVILVLLSGWSLAAAGNESHASTRLLASRVGLLACVVYFAAQTLAIARWYVAWPIDEGNVVSTEFSPVISWIREYTTPDEVLLSTDGAEIAAWCPNPVLRLQRRPHSSGLTSSWSQVDLLAEKANARFLIHWSGDDASTLGAEWAKWMGELDQPMLAGTRHIATIGRHVIYSVRTPSTPGVRP